MRISTKGTYGLRSMVDLGLHGGNGPVPLKSIAARQNVSELYLEQIFALLRKSSLVSSKRGVGGGYNLERPARDISALDILEALEGDLAITQCLKEDAKDCDRQDHCPTLDLWNRLNDTIRETLTSVSLQELMDQSCEKTNRPDEAPSSHAGN